MFRIALLFVAALVLTATASAQSKNSLCNNTAYKMNFVFNVLSNQRLTTYGWYNVDPGDCQDWSVGVGEKAWVTASIYGRRDLYWDNGADIKLCVGNTSDAFEVDYPANGSYCPSKTTVRPAYLLKGGSRGFTWSGGLPARPSSKDDDAALGAALLLGGIALWAWGADAADKADQEACMRRCTKSRARCVRLCTQ